jgi:hypothetical protein
VRKVVFAEDGKRIGVDTTGPGGLYSLPWKTGKLKKGKVLLTATVYDSAGRHSSAGRLEHICK